jgi:glutathione synthase
MRIGFIINSFESEKSGFTTVRLGLKAHNNGHEAYFMSVGDLIYYPDGLMGARARSAPSKKYKTSKTFLNALRSDSAVYKKITAKDLDILMLRNDPAEEPKTRSWAQSAGFVFGQLAVQHGVIVLNDPMILSQAINKMYFQHFPESVRPNTLITRDVKEIREFFASQKEKIILKPLQGSGGKNVFLVNKQSVSNLNQMIEAIGRDGYVIAQEYLPDAAKGDIRLFVMNGEALIYKDRYAAFRRVSSKHDIRSNLHAGGKPRAAKITDEILQIVEMVRPKLISDGMFLVGLDIVGTKLMEINVFSPGGIGSASDLEEVDFADKIIEALERKVHYKKLYKDQINNKTLAVL